VNTKRKKYKEPMKQKVGSLKKINKIDKCLAKLTKGKKKKTQINQMKREISQQITMKYRGALGNTLKSYILIN
jgi:sugar diacid utilization regulator